MSELCKNQATDGGYNYLPATEENGPLAKYKIGQLVEKTVRTMFCIYQDGQGFYIYDVEEDDRRFVMKGSFPYALAMNAYYRITGTVTLDKRRGTRQITVATCSATLPTDKKGIITVLQTLHGLDTQAWKLYDIIGPDILNILKTDPKQVVDKVVGVGIKRARGWQQELLARGEYDIELKKLYDLGLNQQQATRLVAEYGIEVCESVRKNPYMLIGKVRGYSFGTCDKYALDTGISIRDPIRISEGILYTLRTIDMRGHCTYPREDFMRAVHDLLDVCLNLRTAKQIVHAQKPGTGFNGRFGSQVYYIPVDDLSAEIQEWESEPHWKSDRFRYILDHIPDRDIQSEMSNLMTGNKLIIERVAGKEYVTPGCFYEAEQSIAANLRDITANEMASFRDVDRVIDEVLSEQGVTLETKQMEAVRRICRAKGGAFILNGSAGCGKTFTLNIIMRVLAKLYAQEDAGLFNPCILAPTGKAAKVAARATGLPAQTIHKALGLVSAGDGDTVQISAKTVLNNCIVVDEFSMVDEILCSALLDGVPKTAKVIFLGDTEQLPSIRAGRVLKDIIESEAVPVITLDVVKRQDAQSGILVNATKIIHGESISSVVTNQGGMKGNAYVLECAEPESVREQIVRMAHQYGLRGFQEGVVQILCPLKAGITGVEAMNYALQNALNPKSDANEIVVGRMKLKGEDGREEDVPRVFRVGDVVINIRNNYNQPWFEKHPINGFIETSQMGVVNGDTGVVDAISVYRDGNNMTHRVIFVRYDDHYIAYDNEYDDLSLAYALTIHKSQGSQWPNIICPLVQSSIILNRKLLYTMYTRAQDSCVLIGSKGIIDKTIENNREDLRMTLLTKRLRREI